MTVEKNIRLSVSYDGSRYHGWQRQDNAMTVQEMIEEKLQTIVGVEIRLTASGRTDAGVHALHQTCNFRTSTSIPPDSLRKGLNALLPDDIFIKDAQNVSFDFHSRYDCKSKMYEYRILNREAPDIFRRKYVWHIRRPLDIDGVCHCMDLLKGTRDFSSFKSTGSGNTNPVRTVFLAEFGGAQGDLFFRIKADGFLRHMVRNIVGTLVDVGRGKITPTQFKEILDSRDRQKAGIKAPPQGLFLMEVNY
jgi:tRNA pseudouridine38-40 synthase